MFDRSLGSKKQQHSIIRVRVDDGAGGKKKRKVRRQSKLDFGQKRNEECDVCGLLYELGNLREAQTHKRECDAYVFGSRHRVLKETKQVKFVVTRDEEILKKMHRLIDRELGSSGVPTSASTAYLVLDREKLVVGCALVVSREGGVGIEKLWVRENWRRKRIAWTLLDEIRTHSAFQYTIPKTKLAFTQPTTLGRHFMSAYLGESVALNIY